MPDVLVSLPSFAAVLAIVSLAGVFRGFSGFGLALVAMPFLVLIIPPAAAVIAILVVQLTMGLLDLRECLEWADRRAVTTLSLAALLGTPAGFYAISFMPLFLAQIIIGAITAAAAASLFFQASFGSGAGPVKTALIGFVSGLFGGLAAAPGPPIVAYFLARPIPARSKRASMILFFSVSALIAVLSAAAQGTLHAEVVILGLAAAPFCYAGSWLGARFFRRGSEVLYRNIALWVLEASALFSIGLGILSLIRHA